MMIVTRAQYKQKATRMGSSKRAALGIIDAHASAASKRNAGLKESKKVVGYVGSGITEDTKDT